MAGSYVSAFRNPAGVLFVVIVGVIYGVVWIGILVRFGLIAFMAYQLSDLLISGVVTLNPSAWYAGPSFLNLTAIASLAAYAAWVCLSMRRAPTAVKVTSSQRTAAV